MLVKMRRDAVPDEVGAVEQKLHGLGFKTGKMVGEEITLIGVYGDISRLPVGEIEELPGVERLIPISRAYKRAAQKGSPERPLYQTVRIGFSLQQTGYASALSLVFFVLVLAVSLVQRYLTRDKDVKK